jgi:hypothetical protein
MKIVITGPATFECLSIEKPEPGMVYQLEDAAEGTGPQNRAFHALVQEYWRSGCHSYNVKSFSEFRNLIKRDLGAGFERFVYATIEIGRPMLHDAPTYADIPESVRKDPDLKDLCRGRLKSWTDYTKKERRETIDRLIAQMDDAGVRTKKYFDILEGMSEWRRAGRDGSEGQGV